LATIRPATDALTRTAMFRSQAESHDRRVATLFRRSAKEPLFDTSARTNRDRIPISLCFLVGLSRQISSESSSTCRESIGVCDSSLKYIGIQIIETIADDKPLSQNVPSKIVAFQFMANESRFTRDVLFYSGLMRATRQSSHQFRGLSAEFRGGIKCDRRK
jgi:hypothetical protein